MKKKTVAICDRQPLMCEGLRMLLEASADLEFSGSHGSLQGALQQAHLTAPAVLIIDKDFGEQPVLESLVVLQAVSPQTAAVVWGASVADSEAARFLRAGARGIIRKSADPEALEICLRSVASGAAWLERSLPVQRPRSQNCRGELTARECQVLELVERGLNNREVAGELGIRPGTVKIHLKHIFEKTGAGRGHSPALAVFVPGASLRRQAGGARYRGNP